MSERILTVKEAAEELYRTPGTVYRMIKTGKLKATKEKGRWKIKQEDILAYHQKRLDELNEGLALLWQMAGIGDWRS